MNGTQAGRAGQGELPIGSRPAAHRGKGRPSTRR